MRLKDVMEMAEGRKLSEAVLEIEAKEQKKTREELICEMAARLAVMRESVARGVAGTELSHSGLCGRNAALFRDSSTILLGPVGKNAMLYALAVAEENARMGRIVAAPTAGACGILPGVILAIGQELALDESLLVLSLFAAGSVGRVIAENATLAGAEGGCQAECGSAAAMAAAAAVELLGGSAQQCGQAAALALKCTMGLVCDPVCGLVEVPCVKRNASGAATALAAASMALSGIQSVIPIDEVIDAMGVVGRAMPSELRETSKGGLAATPTAVQLTINN